MNFTDYMVTPRKRQRKIFDLDDEQEEKNEVKNLLNQQQNESKCKKQGKNESQIKENQGLKRLLQQDSNSNKSFTKIIHKINEQYAVNKQKFKETSKDKRFERPVMNNKIQNQVIKQDKVNKSIRSKMSYKEQQTSEQDTHSRSVFKTKRSSDNIQTKTQDNHQLINQVAVRWWYCMPHWPPQNYNYDKQLKKLGYRPVQQSKFKTENDLVGGLLKATPVKGYFGIFKTKQKIIDLRPQQWRPSLSYFRKKSYQELYEMLKISLNNQMNQLKKIEFPREADRQLLKELEKKYIKYSS